MGRSKKTILVDFDGVLHDYKGWVGPEERFLNPPIEKARHACHILSRDYRLVCFTTRPVEMAARWLRHYGFPEMRVTNMKEPAFLIIDDRAICFEGQWTDEFLARIKSFEPHWQSGLGQVLSEESEQSSQQPPDDSGGSSTPPE